MYHACPGSYDPFLFFFHTFTFQLNPFSTAVPMWGQNTWSKTRKIFLGVGNGLTGQQAVVTCVVPSPSRFLPSIFIAHRVQQSHCSSIFHRVILLTHTDHITTNSKADSSLSTTKVLKIGRMGARIHHFYSIPDHQLI